MSFRSLTHRLLALALFVCLGAAGREAFAIKQFADQFSELYVKEGTPLAAAVQTAKCNVCHVGKKKSERNAYGAALAKLLDKKADKDDVEKIRKALETVANESSNPEDPAAPTFGDLIEAGKLPGGAVE
jgi:hypothetical protein